MRRIGLTPRPPHFTCPCIESTRANLWVTLSVCLAYIYASATAHTKNGYSRCWIGYIRLVGGCLFHDFVCILTSYNFWLIRYV